MSADISDNGCDKSSRAELWAEGWSVEDRVDEASGVERGEVVGAFAQADELHRDAELRWIATTMPPLAVPSSLVSTMPVMLTASAKTSAWLRPFWPVVASRTSRPRRWGLLLDDALDLAELVHQADLVLQAAGGVDDDDVGFARRPALTASKATAAGSAPSLSD